tara:strand:- start:605 stop:805 length:201 start_codon:yes stop_codon:yes gene_type:complete
MTDEQLLELVEEYFVELNPFSGFITKEYTGKLDAFVKFYREAYSQGWREGYDDGYDQGCHEATGGN